VPNFDPAGRKDQDTQDPVKIENFEEMRCREGINPAGKQALMVGRILNRRELRKQAGQAEQPGTAVLDAAVPLEKVRKAPARKKKTPAKKAPTRRCARWGVFDGTMKQVAIFDYSQRAAAEEKLANLLATKKGIHFLQIVKEPMPEPVPVEAPVAD
jgi:hypothetical protein